MKLPLSYLAIRMKKSCDFKAEICLEAFPREAIAQGDQPRGDQGGAPGVEHDP